MSCTPSSAARAESRSMMCWAAERLSEPGSTTSMWTRLGLVIQTPRNHSKVEEARKVEQALRAIGLLVQEKRYVTASEAVAGPGDDRVGPVSFALDVEERCRYGFAAAVPPGDQRAERWLVPRDLRDVERVPFGEDLVDPRPSVAQDLRQEAAERCILLRTQEEPPRPGPGGDHHEPFAEPVEQRLEVGDVPIAALGQEELVTPRPLGDEAQEVAMLAGLPGECG